MDEKQITIYTRRGCHLCENAEALLHRLGYRYTAIDVDENADLRTRYGDEVPVIAVDGQPILYGIIEERAVLPALRR